MADQVQFRGGTSAQHATFTGAVREITVDTDKHVTVVHDGATAGGFPLLRQDLGNLPANSITANMLVAGLIDPMSFLKADSQTPAFVKTSASTISVKAGTYATVAGVSVAFSVQTPVVMPGTFPTGDYAIYVCTDGTIRADSSTSAPTGYTTANSRKIGGFHNGAVSPGTTVAGGSFATTGNGMIWTQPDVDNIAGINMFSIWDLKFRPKTADPRGMVLVDNQLWVDIYLCSTDTDANGTSKYGSNVASGSVLPKIPVVFGGNGTATYPSLNWWVANELARAQKKRLMWYHEFVTAAFGVTENQSYDAGSTTIASTGRYAGFTSKYGIEQATGCQNTWLLESNYYGEAASPGSTWKTVDGNTGASGSERGSINTFGTYGWTRGVAGGARSQSGTNAGSRNISFAYPWNTGWMYGLRAACEHSIVA